MARGCRCFADLCTLTVLASFVGIGFYFTIKHANEDYGAGVYIPVLFPDSKNYNDIKSYLLQHNVSKEESFDDKTSPQHYALTWIADTDDAALSVDSGDGPTIIQRYVLTVLFYSTDGATSWKESNGFLTEQKECVWFGIECDGNQTVLEIKLADNNLVGPAPFYEIASLTYLNSLDMKQNMLRSSIPDKFFEMLDFLQVLDLSYNDLTGTISHLITERKNLTQLILNNNHFSGTIPLQFRNLKSLTKVCLSANELEGEIPELYSLTRVEELLLGDNNFNGTLPNDLFWMTKLKKLDLFANKFTGTIHQNYGNFKQLTRLQLAGNMLEGEIPMQLGKVTPLKYLTLQYNNFTGDVPNDICDLEYLKLLEADCECADGPSIACSCCTSCCCHSNGNFACQPTSQS